MQSFIRLHQVCQSAENVEELFQFEPNCHPRHELYHLFLSEVCFDIRISYECEKLVPLSCDNTASSAYVNV